MLSSLCFQYCDMGLRRDRCRHVLWMPCNLEAAFPEDLPSRLSWHIWTEAERRRVKSPVSPEFEKDL